MRNRAKCKLCQDVIESYTILDHVECKCGEISISGGNHELNCMAMDWDNFLRVDDQGNTIVPTIKPKHRKDPILVFPDDVPIIKQSPTYHEMIGSLESYVKVLNELPSDTQNAFVTCLDLMAVTNYILQIFKKMASYVESPSIEP
jgi:hypothetical protein